MLRLECWSSGFPVPYRRSWAKTPAKDKICFPLSKLAHIVFVSFLIPTERKKSTFSSVFAQCTNRSTVRLELLGDNSSKLDRFPSLF